MNLWYPLPQPPEDWDYKDMLVPLAGLSFKNWNYLMSRRVQKKRERFPECRKEVIAWTETMVMQSSWVNRKIKMVKTLIPTLESLKQEDCELKASLGLNTYPCTRGGMGDGLHKSKRLNQKE